MKFVTIIFERRLDNVLTKTQTSSYETEHLITAATYYSRQGILIKLVSVSGSVGKQLFPENEVTRLTELIQNEAVGMQGAMAKKQP